MAVILQDGRMVSIFPSTDLADIGSSCRKMTSIMRASPHAWMNLSTVDLICVAT